MSEPVWIWQRIISPHVAGLAGALAAQGRNVVYVTGQEMTPDRRKQGWKVPDLGSAALEIAAEGGDISRLIELAPPEAIHICQGIRGNRHISAVQRQLARARRRQWIQLETIREGGLRGPVKRGVYRHLFAKSLPALEGILAIGQRTKSWIEARGVPAGHVYPFAYFLPEWKWETPSHHRTGANFRFLFVGQFIPRKRLDLLIANLSKLNAPGVELTVIGSGQLEGKLKQMAHDKLGIKRIRWVGKLPMESVRGEMAEADCLVLPSDHDGWGAVVSEALMVGTPVICSDRCGAAGVVIESDTGGVFAAKDGAGLTNLLKAAVNEGRQSPGQRTALASWARCLGAASGAEYLNDIIANHTNGGPVPVPPWITKAAQPSTNA